MSNTTQEASTVNVSTTVDLLISATDTDIATFKHFILHATQIDILEFPKAYAKQAKALGFNNVYIDDALNKFLNSVQKYRKNLGKKQTFLPFENELQCLRRAKGEFEFEFAPWRKDSWVNKTM